MELYINGEQIDAALENERTVGDVLKSFELTCEENDAAVIGIHVDGRKVTAEEFDEEAAKPLSPHTKFEFDVITKQAVRDSFKKCAELFRELEAQMEQIPVNLQSGKDKSVHLTITALADKIDEFCHIAALASLFDDYTAATIDGKPFADFFAEFTPVLADFEQALKANDTVSVGDLAEYEICPRLNAIASTLEGIA
ncbi:MAG: hypothetical protein K2H09_02960 [Treponemataceae bacterium]|nr:hypothetical protein [Treponemataceae bacterium]